MMPISVCGKVRDRRAKFPPRVLIVDDEPLVCWSLAAGLQSAGFDAVTASSGEDAMRIARQQPPPDVVLLDVRPYGSDLGTLLADLRAIAPGCRFLVLATAGQDVPVFSKNGITIVEKPFDLADVVRLVDRTADDEPVSRVSSCADGRPQ